MEAYLVSVNRWLKIFAGKDQEQFSSCCLAAHCSGSQLTGPSRMGPPGFRGEREGTLPITLPQVLPWPGPSPSCAWLTGAPSAPEPGGLCAALSFGMPAPLLPAQVESVLSLRGTQAFYPQELRVGGVLPARWMQSCLRETLGRKEEASDTLPSPPGSRTHHTKHFGERSPQFR